MGRARAWLAALVVGVCLSGAESARAELADDVALLSHAWQSSGSVRVLPARVMHRGELRPVLLVGPETDGGSNDCVDVAVLGAPSATFVVRFTGGAAFGIDPRDQVRPSVAGSVELVLCGTRKALLASLQIDMRSPRAVVRVVIARGPVPPRPLRTVLVRRDPGPPSPPASPGPVPPSAPLAVRTGAVERGERRQAAQELSRRLLHADDSGAGDVLLGLVQGCHRLDLFGADGARAVDIDAQVSQPATGDVLSSDRSDSADATASFCLGTSTTVRLRYVGAPPRGSVLVLQARWALPRGLPATWSPEARARMAQALREHRVKDPATSPVYTSLGVSGVTALPVETEPGACYLVAATVIRGDASSIAVAATPLSGSSQNRSAEDADGTAVAFCAGGSIQATVEVEAQGPGVAWLLAMWQTGRVPIDEEIR